MKKILTFSIFCLSFAPNVFGATLHWWEQPTVCKLDPTKCYTTMGMGYDNELWDSDTKCWGMKLICPEALTTGGKEPVAMSRNAISKKTGIDNDFDTNVLNGDCFGARKTKNNGSMASVNGEYIRVWCNGILDEISVNKNEDEYLENGEITNGTEPTCKELAEYGYVATENGKCYGKYYDLAKYYIECDDKGILPSRIIVLNGADYMSSSDKSPTDASSASKIFDSMESVSKSQRKIYFKE